MVQVEKFDAFTLALLWCIEHDLEPHWEALVSIHTDDVYGLGTMQRPDLDHEARMIFTQLLICSTNPHSWMQLFNYTSEEL